MKKSPSRFVRRLSILTGMALCIYCGGSGENSTIRNRDFVFVNAANGTTNLRAEVVGDDGSFQITAGVGFGIASPIRTIVRSNDEMDARVSQPGGGYTASKLTGPVGNLNLLVATQTQAGSVLDNIILDPLNNPRILMVMDGPIAGFPSADVYVTAPGVDLGTVTADATISQHGEILRLPDDALHPNTAFQVRLTAPGTKNVIANYGTNAGIAANHYHLLLAVHNGTNLVTTPFTFNAKR